MEAWRGKLNIVIKEICGYDCFLDKRILFLSFIYPYHKIMFFKFIFKREKKNFQKKNKYKFDIYNWMKLTKEERLEIDSKEKDESMRKNKALLQSIRDEYIKIKNKTK